MAILLEADRIASFSEFDGNFSKLAAAGFARIDDVIKCQFCQLEIESNNADAFQWHIEKMPGCKYLQQLNKINCRDLVIKRHLFEISDIGIKIRDDCLDEIVWGQIRFPHLKNFDIRVLTFNRWPRQMRQSAYDMARAGFYYTESSDVVCCYWCEQTLSGWEVTDDPINEHARHNDKCPLVRKNGWKYVPDKVEESNIEEYKLCNICCMEEKKIAYVPCGHFRTCEYCSTKVSICQVCREVIVNKLRIY